MAGALGIERRRRKQKLEICAERLVNIELRIPLPVASEFQFPSYTGECRSHQAIIHLTRHRPGGRVQLLPSTFEFCELPPITRHCGRRPIRKPVAWTLNTVHVVVRDRLLNGAPRPEITR